MDQQPLTIGEYRILEKLDEGRWSTIYKAEQAAINALVAVKVFHPNLQGIPAYFEALRALNIQRLTNIFSFGETTEGRFYLSCELLHGRNLEDELRQKGPLQPQQATQIIKDLVDIFVALDQPYQVLKPNHVFLQKDPNGRHRTVLLGFGELGLFLANQHPTLCGPGASLSEVSLYSPEQVQGQQSKVTNDIYSLGALWYLMLTGKPPYPGDSIIQVLADIMTKPFPDLRNECPLLPASQEQVLQRMTQREESDRFQSFIELKNALHQSAPTTAPVSTDKSYFFPSAELSFRRLPRTVAARLLEMQERENDPLRLQEYSWRSQFLGGFFQWKNCFWYLHPTYLLGRDQDRLRIFSWAYLQRVGFQDDIVSLSFLEDFRSFGVIERGGLQPASKTTIQVQYNGSTQTLFEAVTTFAEKVRGLNYQKQAHTAPEADLFFDMLDWRR